MKIVCSVYANLYKSYNNKYINVNYNNPKTILMPYELVHVHLVTASIKSSFWLIHNFCPKKQCRLYLLIAMINFCLTNI